jgi:ribosomal protein S18 acetylase RimI-like enzyme
VTRLRIRTATSDDVASCVSLVLAVAGGSRADWRRRFEQDVTDPERLLVVAVRDGSVVGYGRAHRFARPDDADADCAPEGYYLLGLLVEQQSRRLGVAAALTQARLNWVAARAPEAWYFTNVQNVASIRLHERFGFRETTRRFSFPNEDFDGGEGALFRVELDVGSA